MKIVTRREYGREVLKEKEYKLDLLEKSILKYQETLWEGYACVDDNTYNTCIDYLEVLNPWSDILKSPVKINNIYSIDDELMETLWDIISDSAEHLYFMLNPQGMNIRLHYNKGVLEKAETYGKTLGELDVTEIIKKVIGSKNDLIDKEGKVVLIGTLVLPEINMDLAKDLCNAQDSYTGVFSVIRAVEGMTEIDEDIEDYTDVLMFICTDLEIEGLPDINRENKINYIKDFGIETAPILKVEREGSDIVTVDDAVYTFETLYGNIDYKTDGIRILPSDVSDKDIYLLRVKKWGRVVISSIVMGIEWANTIHGYNPVLKLDREIVFSRTKIETIELNNILYILFMGIEVGGIIRFIYSEEFGVIIIDEDNNLVIL